MIIIRLRGGLGNQMFQYAFGKQLATRFNTKLVLDLSSLLRVHRGKDVTNRKYQLNIFDIEPHFLIHPKIINILVRLRLNVVLQGVKAIKLIGISKVKERFFHYDTNLAISFSNNKLYSGYWQTEKYFKDVCKALKKDFVFKGELSNAALKIYKTIKNTNSVCIHIRRGDYVNLSSFNLLDLEYYNKGVQYIFKEHQNAHFFVFSDDPQWCNEHVTFDKPYTIVDYQTDNLKFKEDLWLMTSCNHFIISASTFSWWAVWLGKSAQSIIIGPKKWSLNTTINTEDIYSDTWVLF